MKVLSTEGLTKLIQLVKGAFISVDDTVQATEVSTTTASEINVSRVAITGSYSDLNNKPTIPNRTSQLYNDSGYVNSTALNNKQDRLISGDNIKTINGDSILGSGDLVIQSGGDPINNRDGVSHLPMWEGTQTQWNQYSNSTWYDWETGPIPVWSEGGELPSSASWQSVTYGDGKFVAIAFQSGSAAYSTDGINWVASTLPSFAKWRSVTYGDGKFVIVVQGSDKAAYSTDGINWTETTLPSSVYWLSVTYGDGKFIAVAGNNSDKAVYSTDGINWTESTLPSSASWVSVTYGNGKFVAIAQSSSKSAYSTDGINWTETTLPSSADWTSVTYGDEKFVAIAQSSSKSAYSTDGINWVEATMPSYADWHSVAYDDDKFIAVVGYNSDKAAYSTDGINWTASTLPSSASWRSITYGDGKFVTVASNSDASAILTMSTEGESCYTLDENPTTSSIVYESPNNRSNLTVTSYDSGLGTLTLSDGNTYEYTASSDITAWRNVADAHPDWLCNIEGVGVKVGNTMIANEGSVVAGCTNAEIQNIWENN